MAAFLFGADPAVIPIYAKKHRIFPSIWAKKFRRSTTLHSATFSLLLQK
jgi:hypothetical protein